MAAGTLVSLEEYLALPESKTGREYDKGRVIELSAPSQLHADVQMNVGYAFKAFLLTSGLGIGLRGPTGYWLTPEVERVPDVSLVRLTKLAALEVFHGSVRGAPDVAIEIISPNEHAGELEREVEQYLAAGVLAVILIYPDSQHVHVHRPRGEARRLGTGDTLEIPELLPGFKLAIDEIFR